MEQVIDFFPDDHQVRVRARSDASGAHPVRASIDLDRRRDTVCSDCGHPNAVRDLATLEVRGPVDDSALPVAAEGDERLVLPEAVVRRNDGRRSPYHRVGLSSRQGDLVRALPPRGYGVARRCNGDLRVVCDGPVFTEHGEGIPETRRRRVPLRDDLDRSLLDARVERDGVAGSVHTERDPSLGDVLWLDDDGASQPIVGSNAHPMTSSPSDHSAIALPSAATATSGVEISSSVSAILKAAPSSHAGGTH